MDALQEDYLKKGEKMNKNRTIRTASAALFAIIGVVLMADTATAASVSNGDIHVANGAASFSIASDPVTVQRGDYVYKV